MFRRRTTTLPLTLAAIALAILGPGRLANGEQQPAAEPQAASLDELLSRGETLYREMCVSCHGPQGEGTDDYYPEPLVGDATTGELSELIADTMPEDDPEACVGADAEAVAAYIHHAFYSEAAQVRNRPPRIGLARLTGDQLRQSIADLYASFEGVPDRKEERGVKAIYFDGDRRKDEKKKIERVDPRIDFDWGNGSPGEEIRPKAFYVHWQGGIKADVSGRYEIVVRSTCSFVMNFGRLDRELINNHVQSGDKTEFRRTVTLTAGRIYPFKIDFVQRERSTEQPPARISVSWIPPHGTEEIIPERNYIPEAAPPTYSLQALLPADDRSYGYERGIAIDRQWDDSTTAAALEFADIASEELWPRYQQKHQKDENGNREVLRGFLEEIVSAAFRQPLTDELRELYIDQQVDATEDDAEAIKRSMLVSLKSPRFLYPRLDQHLPPSQRAANRLALTLFDSVPTDDWLVALAAKDELKTEDQIRAAARRMVGDYRTEAKTRQMLHAWLNLEHIGEITKNGEAFPGFDAELVAHLRHSLNAMIDEIVWSDTSDFRQFFQADWAYTSKRIAEFYGEEWKPSDPDAALSRTAGDPPLRAGVLSHPLLLSGLAYHDTTSPIHRGVFLIRYMLGRTLRPPNEAFTPLSPDLHPELTTRQRVSLQTGADSCQVCHSKINALGFALENFDAVGRYRTEENSKPIDATGSYITRSGAEVKFDGARELAEFLATSDDSHQAFVDRAFQHFVKQPVAAYGPGTLENLTRSFKESGFSIRELLVEIAVIAALEASDSQEQEI